MATAQAIAKGVRHTPRKVGEIAALIRDRTVEDALVILAHTPRRAAEPVRKAVESAAANATNNHNLKSDSLVISSIEIGVGPSMKRFRPGARGMAKPYERKSAHIKVVLSGDERQKKSAKKPTTTTKKKDEAKSTKETK
jgi:large subunit ribosomal protein L22